MNARLEAVVREASSGDAAGIQDLVARVGFDGADSPAENRARTSGISGEATATRAEWSRPDNPALGFREPPLPIGWVIEAEGRVVGYYGNVPQLYQLGARTLLAAAASGYIVEPGYRGLSFSLAARYFDQPGVDLFLATSASPISGRVLKALRCHPLPEPSYDRVLYWVTAASGFAAAALRKLSVPSPWAGLARWPLAAALAIDGLKRGPRATARAATRDVARVALCGVGEEFDELWRRKLAEPPRLMAWRTSAALKWHFHHLDQTGGADVLSFRRGGELRGYVILARVDSPLAGLKRQRVVDMLALEDSPEVVDGLLGAAYERARAAGVHVLELVGFPPAIRRLMLAGRPRVRRYPTWPYFYRADDPALADELSPAGAWYACPYDGDAALF